MRITEVTLSFDSVGLAKLFGHHSLVNQGHFSPDGRRAVSASNDNSLKLWDTRSMTKNYGKSYVKVATFSGHNKPVNAAAFSPDSSTVVSASDDNTLVVRISTYYHGSGCWC
jgi:WD40 repeat protein